MAAKIPPVAIAAGVGLLALILAGRAKAAVEEEEEFEEEEEEKEGEDVTEEEEKDWPYKDRFPNPAAVEAELDALGYTGKYAAKVRQFQRDTRVPSLSTFVTKTAVDGDVGPATLRRLAKTQDLRKAGTWPDTAVQDGWTPGESKIALWPGMGGTAAFFSALKELGYSVKSRRPNEATILFQKDVRAFFGEAASELRKDGLVDNATLAWVPTAAQDPNFVPGYSEY